MRVEKVSVFHLFFRHYFESQAGIVIAVPPQNALGPYQVCFPGINATPYKLNVHEIVPL